MFTRRVLAIRSSSSSTYFHPKTTLGARLLSDSGGKKPADKNHKPTSKNEKLHSPMKKTTNLGNIISSMKVDDKLADSKISVSSSLLLNLSKPPPRFKSKDDVPKPETSEPKQQPTVDKQDEKVPIEPELVEAAKRVSEALPPDYGPVVESELLAKLRQHSTANLNDTSSLNDVIVGMKIDRTQRSQPEPNRWLSAQPEMPFMSREEADYRGAIPKMASEGFSKKKPKTPTHLDRIFGHQPLNIFTNTTFKDALEFPRLKTWDRLKERELNFVRWQHPRNALEEMIQWTNQGKLWKFPINNEQGLEAENEIGFEEHVFLDDKLAELKFPDSTPVRRFMELVCIGMSKSPYMTVQLKHDTLRWYEKYFNERAHLLVEPEQKTTEEV